MNKIFVLLFLLVMCTTSACENEELDHPPWVDNWIQEIESNQYCVACEIFRYQYQSEYYYELYSPVFSCYPCQIHDSEGNNVNASFDVQDYIDKRKNKRLIYRKSSE